MAILRSIVWRLSCARSANAAIGRMLSIYGGKRPIELYTTLAIRHCDMTECDVASRRMVVRFDYRIGKHLSCLRCPLGLFIAALRHCLFFRAVVSPAASAAFVFILPDRSSDPLPVLPD